MEKDLEKYLDKQADSTGITGIVKNGNYRINDWPRGAGR